MLPRLPYETYLLCHLGGPASDLAGDFYTRQLIKYIYECILYCFI